MSTRINERIVVLDFGSQVSQLIVRRIRDMNVYCELLPYNTPIEKILEKDPKGIVLSGGPSSVLDSDAPKLPDDFFDKIDVPVLGICYGMQLITLMMGGQVAPSGKAEYGRADLSVTDTSILFKGFDTTDPFVVWMSHGDRIEAMPAGFTSIAKSDNSPVAAMVDRDRKLWAVQFHPEVSHTPRGKEILGNFIFEACGCAPLWTMANFIETTIAEVREKVGDAKVICGLSGGVDSSVVAVLLQKAIGDQLTCIFVNNGVLRKNEAQRVQEVFAGKLGINLVYVDAAEQFLSKLAGVTDPEKKRKIIGNEFIAVFEEQSNKIENVRFLAQGTLYPDVIESISFKGPSATIKSHHNVGGLPDHMNLELIEPLRELFKDEVRELGRELQMPENVIQRQPFPGPGLAVRIVGEVTPENVEILQNADDVIVNEIKKAGYYTKLWQTFGVFLPVKTVGVMGDERTYEYVIAIRAVDSVDGMTADWAPLPYDLLGRISNRIINEVQGVNRVVYDISSKPPGTIEWE
jgi:GMP synthase (glutamine-hydrolysing)